MELVDLVQINIKNDYLKFTTDMPDSPLILNSKDTPKQIVTNSWPNPNLGGSDLHLKTTVLHLNNLSKKAFLKKKINFKKGGGLYFTCTRFSKLMEISLLLIDKVKWQGNSQTRNGRLSNEWVQEITQSIFKQEHTIKTGSSTIFAYKLLYKIEGNMAYPHYSREMVVQRN